MKNALIFGVSGQDGCYLAELLLSKGYRVFGVSRDHTKNNFVNLRYLNILNRVEVISGKASDFDSVMRVLHKSSPDEIYNLSGQSSVNLSFQYPAETLESIIIGTQNILDGIRAYNSKIKFFNACSTDCFGDTGDKVADESTIFQPQSPYSIGKSTAFWQVKNYRKTYGIFACSGILSNHESPLRPAHFVIQKIVSGACRIALGDNKSLHLGNLGVERDWGWAPEYVEAMWLMLQHYQPDDFIIATGKSTSLVEIVDKVFCSLGLTYKDYVIVGTHIHRPSDFQITRVSSLKAQSVLGWHPTLGLDLIIAKLVAFKLNK